MLDEVPKAQWLQADRGYDADWFRNASYEKGITPCTAPNYLGARIATANVRAGSVMLSNQPACTALGNSDTARAWATPARRYK